MIASTQIEIFIAVLVFELFRPTFLFINIRETIQDTKFFETSKWSFVGVFSSCISVPLIL